MIMNGKDGPKYNMDNIIWIQLKPRVVPKLRDRPAAHGINGAILWIAKASGASSLVDPRLIFVLSAAKLYT